MMNESEKKLLVDGCIPKGEDCPFKDQCGLAINRSCSYEKLEDKTNHIFSCGFARAFEIEKETK